jgi:hypothetical protein
LLRTEFTSSENNVPTKEIRDLRHKYRVAHTGYLSCVHALSDASEKQDGLSADVVAKEDIAFRALAEARHAFLDGLKGRVQNSK